MINLQKYHWNLRILLVETPNKSDIKYKTIKDEYQNNLQLFHKYYVKMITMVNTKITSPRIKLIGFDGTEKKKYVTLNASKIIKDIQQMPMGSLTRPKNMSLYSDYHPKTSSKGLGFKDKNTALRTIKKIKGKDKTYQKQVVDTMIGRAKYHPHQTKNMRNAIEILRKYKKANLT